ncbi:ATP-binding protein [uncultured Draconibacterium sp.]|uniref:PAS domain-containing sensor histidine kinase n=1 Tax=uncultured Draconibacterium sp. TaxID=1573823 RepID=UPI0029C841E7|nr:ATP-binding protein [uncultured Draconibacterium sp.]
MAENTIISFESLKKMINLVSKPMAIVDDKTMVRAYNQDFALYFRLAKNVSKSFSLKEIISDGVEINELIENQRLKTLRESEFKQEIKINNIDEYSITFKITPVEEDCTEFFLFEIINIYERDHKQISQKLFFFNKLMNEIPLNIYFKDKKSRFILISKPMMKYFGLNSMSEAIGKTDFDFFSPEHAKNAFEDEQKIMQTGEAKTLEEKEVWEDGKVSYVKTTKYPLFDANKQIIGTFGISQDITKLIEYERQLTEAHDDLNKKNEYLKNTLDTLKKTQARLVQSEKMGALGQLVAGIAHEINTPIGAITASALNMKDSIANLKNDIEKVVMKFSKEDLELYMHLLANSDKSTDYLSSKEKRAKKRMFTTQLENKHPEYALKLADILVYMNWDKITPEMEENKNLYTVCKAARNFISLPKNVGNILLASDKTGKVVYALKNYVHKKADGQKVPVNIEESIETVLTLNTNKIKKGVNVIRKYNAEPIIVAYGDQLGQVWNNLISNAVHAMNEKGNLTIAIDNVNGNRISVTITDEGCGIPKEHHKRIFEPFYTTKNVGEGTGMGLDIVKKIVDKHGGTINYATQVGTGTSFIVELPVNSN